MATYDVAAWRDVGTSIAIPHIARLQAIAASEVLEDAASLLWMCGEVLAACEAESTRSSASQAVTRQDKKPRRAPSGVFTIVQKVCNFLPKDPKIFVAQKCADPCRHDGRNTKDSIHEVCCGRKMISFDAQLVRHTEVHPNERVVQAQIEHCIMFSKIKL